MEKNNHEYKYTNATTSHAIGHVHVQLLYAVQLFSIMKFSNAYDLIFNGTLL